MREDWREIITPSLEESIEREQLEEDVEFFFKECYSLWYDGIEYIIVRPYERYICLMFDQETGEQVGIQPLEYVREHGERL